MSAKTKIQWADSSSNAILGCSRISEGCKNCYAFSDTPARVLRHRGIETWGEHGQRVPVKGFEKSMLAMNRKCWISNVTRTGYTMKEMTPDDGSGIDTENFHRRRIFCDSNSDWLDEKWPIETLAHFLDVLRRCPDVVHILCTKRPENFFERMEEVFNHLCADDSRGTPDEFCAWVEQWIEGNPPSNIILLTSVENQPLADKRIPELLKIPAACHGLSLEPLLGPVNVATHILSDRDKAGFDNQFLEPIEGFTDKKIKWCIAGVESGPRRRPCDIDWIEEIVQDCKTYGCACFVKQMSLNGKVSHDPAEWPEHLRVREWPGGLDGSRPPASGTPCRLNSHEN